MIDTAPAQVGPYVPQQLLAAGAQATVWLGTGPSGPVALKIARSEAGGGGLRREAEVLRTPATRTSCGCSTPIPKGEWIALERIEGHVVDQWAQNRSIDEIVDVAIQLVDVLEHLHQRGIVHGDVKPSNVMVTGGVLHGRHHRPGGRRRGHGNRSRRRDGPGRQGRGLPRDPRLRRARAAERAAADPGDGPLRPRRPALHRAHRADPVRGAGSGGADLPAAREPAGAAVGVPPGDPGPARTSCC